MLVVSTNAALDRHDTGAGHPERPERTLAAYAGLIDAGLRGAIIDVPARPATSEELLAVHFPSYLASLERVCAAGGGALDADTIVSSGSWQTARTAAGAGLVALEALEEGRGEAALVLVRPPGHHAGVSQAAGFCLVNNVAVAAAALADRGERVAIVDFDLHHGNGTQDIFWDAPEVLYASVHQAGLFPGTGRPTETGGPRARGTTLNVAVPPGTSGPAMRRALDTLIGPAVSAFGADWVLVSAGFDAHRMDPLGDLCLSAGDYADWGTGLRALAPSGRIVAFLEGGYDLGALRRSVGAFAAGLLGGHYDPEPASTGDIGCAEVDAVATWWSAVPGPGGGELRRW